MDRNEIDKEKRLELANFLNNVKEDRNFGHNQLAMKAGLNGSVLHRMLNGQVRKANPFHLRAIADALRIDYKILYQIVGYMDSPDSLEKSADKLASLQLEQDIPVYSKVHISSSGQLEYGEVLEYITIPRIGTGKETFGIKLNNDSMEGTIPDGATILVKKDVKLSNNEIGVFVYQNNPMVKKIQKKDGITVLLSDNHNHEPIVIFNKDEYSTVGKVVEVMYKV